MEHKYDPTAILTEVLGEEIGSNEAFKADVADLMLKLDTIGAKDTLIGELKLMALSKEAKPIEGPETK